MVHGDRKESTSRYERLERMLFPRWVLQPGKEEDRRITQIGYSAVFIALLVIAIYTSLAFWHHYRFLPLVTMGVAASLAVIILYHRRTEGSHGYTIEAGVSIFGCLCIYLTFSSETAGAGFVWLYTFPLITMFLMGSRRGAIATAMVLLTATILLIFEPFVPYMIIYPLSSKLRFIPSLLVVSVLSYLYEQNRESAQQRLNLTLIELGRSKEAVEQQVQDRTIELYQINKDLFQEIQDRERVEDDLRESEEKYRTILESIEDGYFEIDTMGNLIFFNPAACRALGYSEGKLKGLNYKRIMDEANGKRLKRAFTEIYHTGEAVPFIEFEIMKEDGTRAFIEASISLIKNQNNDPTGFRGVGRDITERRQLEFRLRQAQKMEAIGTLAGGIAHDFNNLLMTIQGNASLLLMNTDPGDADYEKLKAIEDQATVGADLTKQLMGFARVGRYELKPIDMNEVIEKSSSMFGRTKKEIMIHKQYEQALWAVEVDTSQMEQVLMNLYINAWQAMPGGGHIYLETANLFIAEDDEKGFYMKPGRYVKISVTDTGVGMDENTKERIFEPFFTTKEMGRGTGLGLAMVYGIITGHHGHVNVYSELGKGTTFNIYLPASEKEALKGKKLQEVILKGHETILVVDDEKAVGNVIKGLLETLGYNVLTANSGHEALRIYEENKDRISLVVLDMIMPEMSGGETFDLLKEINSDVKVILASGYSLNGEATGIMDRGCQGFIQKPVRMAALSQKIRSVLRGES